MSPTAHATYKANPPAILAITAGHSSEARRVSGWHTQRAAAYKEYLQNYPSSHKSLNFDNWQSSSLTDKTHISRCQERAQLPPKGQKYKKKITHLLRQCPQSVLRHCSLGRGQVTGQHQQLLTWLESHSTSSFSLAWWEGPTPPLPGKCTPPHSEALPVSQLGSWQQRPCNTSVAQLANCSYPELSFPFVGKVHCIWKDVQYTVTQC